MRSSFSLVIISLVVLCTLATGRNRRVAGSSHLGRSFEARLKSLTAEQLKNICQQQIVSSGQPFFYKWVIRSFVDGGFGRPEDLRKKVYNNLREHLDQVNIYFRTMSQLSWNMERYSRVVFDVKVKDLNSRTFDILKAPFHNVYDTAEKVDSLVPTLGPHADNLVQEFSDQPISPLEINQIGEVYRQEDLEPLAPTDPELVRMINENKVDIKAALYGIIDVYTDKDPKKIYPSLTPEQKQFLETYFNAFRYLLDPVEHYTHILQNLLDTTPDLKLVVKDHPFINNDLFGYLQGLNTEYNPIFFRDNFLTKGGLDYKLEDLHSASTPALYSWEFFKSFDGNKYIDARDPTIDDVKEDTPDAKLTRKLARLHAMLYKVYTFAREDGTLPHGHSQDNQEILEKLYNWVLQKAPLFAIPKMTDEGLDNEGHQMHTLFQPEKFRRYYLPLLDLICKKMHKPCGILSTDKPQIIETFIDFGNHNELKESPLVEKIISPEVLEEIRQDAGVKEFKDFADNVENLIDKMEFDMPSFLEEQAYPDDFEAKPQREGKPKTLLQNKLGKPVTYSTLPDKVIRDSFKPVETSKKPSVLPRDSIKPIGPQDSFKPVSSKDDSASEKPTSLAQKELTPRQIQNNFNKIIGERFLPDVDRPDEDPSKKLGQLGKFLDTVDAIENQKKKRQIRNLLMNFIIKSKSKPIVDKFIDHKLVQLRSPLDYKLSTGLRNFLFRTMGEEARYVPASADDEYNYGLDVLFYIFSATKDHLLNLKKENSPSLASEAQKGKKIFESLQKGFVLAPPVGLKDPAAVKGFQDARNKIISGKLDEKFLERSNGVEFFRHFIDFFSYWEKIEAESKAVNVNYYRIYLQFYQILAHLRRGGVQAQAFENPHEYVLLKMEECMIIAQAQEAVIPLVNLNTHCIFSYRKYAEVLYFYKMYLADTKKIVGQSLMEHEKAYDVHTRMFISFAHQNVDYTNRLNSKCKTHSDKFAICTSWNTFKTVLSYLHTESMLDHHLESKLAELSTGSTANKINIFNGFEAAHYFTRITNVAENYKLNLLFATEGVNQEEGIGKMLTFTEKDESDLTRYLSLTYKKLTLESHELKIFDFVTRVLATPETGSVEDDTLIGYLHFIDRVAPFHIKLFLQYAQTDAQFGRLARVLINNKISTNLIAINEVRKDDLFKRLVHEASKLSTDEIPRHIMNEFQAEYANTLKQCTSAVQENIMSFLNDPDLLDILGSPEVVQQSGPVENVADLTERVVANVKAFKNQIKIAEGDDIAALVSKHKQKLISEHIDQNEELLDVEVDYYTESGDEEFEDDEDDWEEVEEGAGIYEQQLSREISEKMSGKLGAIVNQEGPAQGSAGKEVPDELKNVLEGRAQKRMKTNGYRKVRRQKNRDGKGRFVAAKPNQLNPKAKAANNKIIL